MEGRLINRPFFLGCGMLFIPLWSKGKANSTVEKFILIFPGIKQ
jgi:hypothetical protein